MEQGKICPECGKLTPRGWDYCTLCSAILMAEDALGATPEPIPKSVGRRHKDD